MKENVKKVLVNFIGVVLARAVFLGINPIPIGYFSAVYIEPKGRFLIFISIIVGMFMKMPAIDAIKYVVTMIVFTVVVALIEYSKKKITPIISGLLSGGITMVMTMSYGLMSDKVGYYIWIGALEGVIIFVSTLIFRKSLEPILHGLEGQALNNEQVISLAVLLGAIVYGIPDFASLGFSLSLTVALFSVLIIAYKYGAGYGAIAGAACGIILALRNGEINQIGFMCMIGIIAGTFREMGRLLTFTMYSAGFVVLSELYHNSVLNLSGFGALISCAVLFFLLPKTLVGRGKTDIKIYEEIFESQTMQSLEKNKLREFSDSFLNLSATFKAISEPKDTLNKEDKNDLFDELSEKLCKECSNCSFCWNSNFYDTYEGAHRIIEVVEKNGTITLHEIPEGFKNRCISLDHFLFETKRILEVAKLNLSWNNKMAESRAAIAEQLSEVANIIDDFSNDLYRTGKNNELIKTKLLQVLKYNHIQVNKIAVYEKRSERQEIHMTAKMNQGRCITSKEVASMIGDAIGKRMRPSDRCKNVIAKEYDSFIFVEDADYKAMTGIAKMTKEGGRVSGDNYSFIYPDAGTLIMTLSDGMGTGERACEESESVVELLEQFMEAGFRKESAIKLINSILVLKSGEQTFSTIDLSVINLFGGFCDFIKIGASSTFLKRRNEVETITSSTLPAGIINHVDYEAISRKIYDGDFVIMATDGVIDCIPGEEKEEYMNHFIASLKMNNAQEIANAVLNHALELNKWVPKDDMTVLASGFWSK
ncbi:MAG: stage II sporulation protein E [Anaerocolumna sp.]